MITTTSLRGIYPEAIHWLSALWIASPFGFAMTMGDMSLVALFDHKLTYPLRNGIALTISDKNRNKIFSVITILHFILQKISHNSAKDMESEINSLFDQFSSSLIIKEIINNSIGRRNF